MSISDRAQIENLIHSYARGIDSGRLENVAKLFRNGSICDTEGNTIAQGYDSILTMYRSIIKIYPDCGTPKTQHIVSNLILEIEADSLANSTSNYTVFQQLPSGKIECIIAGEYFSKFTKHKNTWEFCEHHMCSRITGDMSHHLLIDVDEIKQRSNDGFTE